MLVCYLKNKMMLLKKLNPNTIEEYIKAAPAGVQQRLRQMHECIGTAAPGATEGLKWSIPAYSYKRILVMFAVFKKSYWFLSYTVGSKSFC
jgi:uncharacterized protein YdhG (YjbR/CyaY superfamily)